ncbi:MAG: S41 family peptidase [Crocinitomicaceae bacterium]
MNILTRVLPFSLLLITSFSQAQTKEQTTVDFSSGNRISEVLAYVERFYVDKVDADKLANDAIIAMLKELDPHTAYIPKDEVDAANQQINGSFVGVGIRFNILEDTLIVVEAIPGGPSAKLGIQAGDQIVSVEGKNIAGVGLKNNEVRDKLLGELGTKVAITIRRKGTPKLLEYSIKRDKIPLNSIASYYMVDDKIGYIKLTSFSRSTYDEIDAAIKELKSKGMSELILDLKDNGGGLLNMAQAVADEFLSDNKLIVYSKGRMQPRADLLAEKKGLFEKGKLIILTDENTASASEIVAGAIQDWDRGLIVGRRTFGKGLVQRPIPLSDGAQMRLTIARYYTPSGRWIQKPYDDLEAYENDRLTRYLHGEYMHKDSINLPDSLMYKTNIKHRVVYGGGGIMPDIFVPLDTMGLSNYFRDLVRTGILYQFTINYVNSRRAELNEKYPTFEVYKAQLGKIYPTIEKEFLDYVAKEKPDIKFNEEEYQTSLKEIRLRVEAYIAQNLWNYDRFYEVYNEGDEIIRRAIQLFQTNEYDKSNLSR